MILTPGPANYILPSSLFSGPQCTLRARYTSNQNDCNADPNPGPAGYNPDLKLTTNSFPKFSLGYRIKDKTGDAHLLPGPSQYNPPNNTIEINRNPKVSLKGRPKSKMEVTPGPADYYRYSTKSYPSFQRPRTTPHTPSKKSNHSPGPADYSSAIKEVGPSFSLRKRLDKMKVVDTPGPNAYDASTKPGNRKVTMKSRFSPFVLVFPSARIDTIRVNV